MTAMHCTAVEADDRASCTCGWKSPQVSSPYGLEQMATWHRLSVDATIDNPLLTAYLAPVSEAERTSPAAKVVADNPLASEWMLHRVRRELLTAEYAWAIPTEPVLHRLAELSPICDLGCGTGYWASLLAKAGAEVLAVDAHPPLGAENRWHRTEGKLFGRQATIRHFVDIVLGDAATFDVPSSHTLMLCWPPYDSSMAAAAFLLGKEPSAAQRRD